MDKEWKPKVGDVVLARGVVTVIWADAMPYKVSFDGREMWFKSAGIRPDAPAPAEMDDVAVLRRAAKLQQDRGNEGVAHFNNYVADRIEAARQAMTPLEALKAARDLMCERGLGDTYEAEAARRAIFAAEKGDTGALSINKTKQVPIATVGGTGWHLGQEVAEANAHLIAAAPDLLEALEHIVPVMPPADAICHNGIVPQEKCSHCGRIARAHAAITKARGA